MMLTQDQINKFIGHMIQFYQEFQVKKIENLEEKLGISKVTLSLIETGKVTINLDMLHKIAFFLGVEMGDLLPKIHDEKMGETIDEL